MAADATAVAPVATQTLDWTVTDIYSCNGDCGGFTVESDQYYGPSLPVVAADATAAAPVATQTLDWTVNDVYSCNIETHNGTCGGFTVASDQFYGPPATTTTALAAPIVATPVDSKVPTPPLFEAFQASSPWLCDDRRRLARSVNS